MKDLVKISGSCAGCTFTKANLLLLTDFQKKKRIRPVIEVSKEYNLNRVVTKHMLFFSRFSGHFASEVWPLVWCLSSGRCSYIHDHGDNSNWTQVYLERWIEDKCWGR